MFYILWLLIFPAIVQADSVSFDDIFSKPAIKGGVPCEDFAENEMAGGYLDFPIVMFSSPDIKNKLPEKLKPRVSCVQGGGDCSCFLLYTDSKSGPDGKLFYEVLPLKEGSVSGKAFWVLAKPGKTMDILKLATVKGVAEINFKDENPDTYSDSSLKTKIKKADISLVPSDVLKKIQKELPTPIMKLKIKSAPGKSPEQSIISMWRSTVDFNTNPKPIEMKYSDAYSSEEAKDESSAVNKPWELVVFEKVGKRYLVGGYMKVTNTNAASYSSEMSDGRVYSWVDFKNLVVEEIPWQKKPLDKEIYNGFPLTIAPVFTAVESETIDGQVFTQLRVDLMMVDPKQPEQPNDPALKTKVYKLRDIWIRSFDKDNRINFWLTTRPGC